MTLRPRAEPAVWRPPGRPRGGPWGRRRSVARARSGARRREHDPVRAGAILAMLVAAAAVYGVANSPAFTYLETRVGATFTDQAEVVAMLEDARGRTCSAS